MLLREAGGQAVPKAPATPPWDQFVLHSSTGDGKQMVLEWGGGDEGGADPGSHNPSPTQSPEENGGWVSASGEAPLWSLSFRICSIRWDIASFLVDSGEEMARTVRRRNVQGTVSSHYKPLVLSGLLLEISHHWILDSMVA